MSTTMMALCWPLQMPPTHKAVLISLADNANDQGACWPSIPTICERSCFSERTVHASIKWLEESGLVKADRSNGRHTRYVITPANFKPPQELHPRSSRTPATAAVVPPQLTQKPPQMAQEPPQELRSNRKEEQPGASKNKSSAFAPDLSCWPQQPSAQVLADWIALRRRLRADVSVTVVNAFARELRAANAMGYTVDDCLTQCVLKGWRGFEAEWMKNAKRPGQAAAPANVPGGGRREL